jgi:hypothetical protein
MVWLQRLSLTNVVFGMQMGMHPESVAMRLKMSRLMTRFWQRGT